MCGRSGGWIGHAAAACRRGQGQRLRPRRCTRRQADNGCGRGSPGCGDSFEALELRAADIEAPILVLGYTPLRQAAEMVRAGVTATVYDMETAHALS